MNRTLHTLAACIALVVSSCTSSPSVIEREDDAWGEVEVSVVSAGNPVAGATVEVWRESRYSGFSLHEQPLGTMPTNGSGLARAVTKSAAVRVTATKEGFVRGQVVVRLEGKRVPTEIDLEPEAIVAGQLLDARGAPVARAGISVQGPGQWDSLQTDATGHFRFRGLPRGVYSLKTTYVPSMYQLPAERDIEAPSEDIVLRLEDSAGAIVLEVVTPPGTEPISGIGYPHVERLDERTGAWRIEEHHSSDPGLRREQERVGQLAPGTYRVMVRLPGVGARVSQPVLVRAASDTALRLELKPGRVLSGRVVDGQGEPVEAWLHLIRDPGGTAGTPTRRDGVFSAANVPEEEFILEIWSNNNTLRKTVVRVQAGTGETRVEFVLP